jgi:hypothetical protein
VSFAVAVAASSSFDLAFCLNMNEGHFFSFVKRRMAAAGRPRCRMK